jgi:hypothetical protein
MQLVGVNQSQQSHALHIVLYCLSAAPPPCQAEEAVKAAGFARAATLQYHDLTHTSDELLVPPPPPPPCPPPPPPGGGGG